VRSAGSIDLSFFFDILPPFDRGSEVRILVIPCSVLQYAAVCCRVVKCVACVAVGAHSAILLSNGYVAITVCCGVLQCVAVCCSVLQCVAVC